MTDVHPLGAHPLGADPLGAHSPGADPLGTHPPGTDPLGAHPPATSPPGDDTGKVESWCPLPPYVDLAARHLQTTGQWAGLVQAETDDQLRRTMARVLATEEDLDCRPDDIAFFESTEQALAHLARTLRARHEHDRPAGRALLDHGATSRHRGVLSSLGFECSVTPALADPSGSGNWATGAARAALEAGPRRGIVLVTVPRTPGGSLPTNEEWAALRGFCRELGLDLVADETKGWPAEDTDCLSAGLLRDRRLPEQTWVLREIPELDHVAPVVYLLRGASHRAWPDPAPLPGDTRALLALLLSSTRDHRDVARNRLRAEHGRLRWSPPLPPIG